MPTPLDRFFDHYYRRRPVNATLTGIHEFDAELPDWSRHGLASLDQEMAELDTALGRIGRDDAAKDMVAVDVGLASDFLAIQRAENAGSHGIRRNPSLWVGEAAFSLISLMIRGFAPVDERVESALKRIEALPAFLDEAPQTIDRETIPPAWTEKACRECEGLRILLSRGLPRWLETAGILGSARGSIERAEAALHRFLEWLSGAKHVPSNGYACGDDLFALLLRRGHRAERNSVDLLRDARRQFDVERARLDEMAAEVAGSWTDAEQAIADDHPSADEYLPSFERVWSAARQCAIENDVVTWPEWPIRYVAFPTWTSEAAPYLYYLFYRSPAPFDQYSVHDYVVPVVPVESAQRHLRTWNNSVIKLNHVVHHGGIGHHVQNWFAYHRASSRVGQIAAVDCANRIGMFSGGTMAEGWASYVPGLMGDLGFLTPFERLSEQHTRVRALARAIVDIELHSGVIGLDEAILFYVDRVGMGQDAARGEAIKNSMFPCTALMYWLGTQSIRNLRLATERRLGSAFYLKRFHDEFLSFGSIPVPLIAQLMSQARSAQQASVSLSPRMTYDEA
jgi:hypothetical protein